MKQIHLLFFLKPILSVFLVCSAIPSVKADDINVGGKYYTNSATGYYKYAAYYDVKGDGTRVLGSAGSDTFEWFNFDNDRYVDGYTAACVWQGDATFTYGYQGSNMMLENDVSFAYQAIDFNNDGRSDIKFGSRFWRSGEYVYNTKPEEVLIYARGQWWPMRFRLLSPEAYRGEQEKMVLHTSIGLGSGISIISGNTSSIAGTALQTIDLNGDGYTDLVDAASGQFYQNLGDGRYVNNEMGGQLTFRDFNDDGVADYVLFDSEDKNISVFLSQTDGSWKERVILSNLYCDEEVSCYDFDKDGDVDILITLSYEAQGHDNGGSFVVLMENQGDGSFKQHEFVMEGRVYFRQCVDLNADGYYELVAQRQEEQPEDERTSNLVYYTVKGMDVADTPVLLKEAVEGWPSDGYKCFVADLDNSGYMCVYYRDEVEEIPGVGVNTRPVALGKPHFVYDAGKGTLKVEWGEGSDAECSVADLTYALRIGTAEGEGDMLFAHALPDGRRRNLLDGNCGYARSRTLNVSSWPAGKYYISVQTVDPGRLGSEFSAYAVFEKEEPAADFILSGKYYFSIGDTCTVVLLGGVEAGCTYDWDWDGATVLSQSEDGGEHKILFTQGGEKRVSLKVTSASGAFTRVEHTLDVNPGNVKEHDFGAEVNDVQVAVDLDEDGRTEVYEFYDAKFYEVDDNAKYSTVKKIWNSNLPERAEPVVADVNRDGMADVMFYDGVFGADSYSLINEGNKQMTLSNVTASVFNCASFQYLMFYWFKDSTHFYRYDWYDFNNDGLLEPGGYRNTGDYAAFEYVEKEYYHKFISDHYDKTFHPNITIDYDRDGLVDFIDMQHRWEKGDGGCVTLFRNNGDFTFTPEKLEWIDWQDSGEYLLEDLDGDGLWDCIHDESGSFGGHSWYSSCIRIQWGDGDTLLIPAEKGIAFSDLEKAMDVDNNGCLDLVFNTGEKSVKLVVYFYKDRTYKIGFFNMEYFDDNDPEYLLTDGRLAYGTTVFSGTTNSKPAAPEHIRASQDDKFVTLEWNHSVDKETPAALMRYNISIRHKGKTGEGAYLISPHNSTKNGVHVPSPYPLIGGNKFKIPIQNIPAGEYEVQVQGVDRGMLESDFSEVYDLTVVGYSIIEMPTSAGVGQEVQVRILDNSGQEVDFGPGASVEKKAGGYYTVVWDSEGSKTVKVGTQESRDIYVYPVPQGSFSLPERVLLGAKVNLEGENMSRCSWTYSLDGGEPRSVDEDSDVKIEVVDECHVVVTFGEAGSYELFHHVADDFNTETYSSVTEVDGENPAPVISVVDIEPESGRYRLNWNADNLPAGAQSINIYKETSRYDEYELLANLPLTETAYVDLSSMPDYSASRYYMTCVLPYGETMASAAHQPIHVMINKGMGNTWNLVWTRYEGRDVESYRILGGASADNLGVIAEVSGHQTSYSDLAASSDMKYYAVETVSGAEPVAKRSNEFSTAVACRSNVVSTDNAISAVLAQQITILSDKEDMVIEGSSGEASLQLMAAIYPLNTTVQRLNWQVAEGNDIATISASGLLTAKEDGIVTVRAYAVDGSGVYGEVQVRVDGLTAVEPVKTESRRPELKASFSEGRLAVRGIPSDEKATLYVYNTNGCLITVGEVSGANATLSCGNIPSGVFLCRVVTGKWAETVRFFKP